MAAKAVETVSQEIAAGETPHGETSVGKAAVLAAEHAPFSQKGSRLPPGPDEESTTVSNDGAPLAEETNANASTGGAVGVARTPSAAGTVAAVATMAAGLEDGLNEEAPEPKLDERLPPAAAAGRAAAEIFADGTAEGTAGSVGNTAAAETTQTGPVARGVVGEVPPGGGVRQATATAEVTAAIEDRAKVCVANGVCFR